MHQHLCLKAFRVVPGQDGCLPSLRLAILNRRPAIAAAARAILCSVAVFLGLTQLALGQETSGPSLKINVIKGKGDVHVKGSKNSSVIEVEVLNELDLPQPDAKVSFSCEKKGPGVLFGENRTDISVVTDAKGIARVDNVRRNDTNGAVAVSVAASFEGKLGGATVNQANVKAPYWTPKKRIVWAAIGATAGLVVWAILKPGPPTVSIDSTTVGTSQLVGPKSPAVARQ